MERLITARYLPLRHFMALKRLKSDFMAEATTLKAQLFWVQQACNESSLTCTIRRSRTDFSPCHMFQHDFMQISTCRFQHVDVQFTCHAFPELQVVPGVEPQLSGKHAFEKGCWTIAPTVVFRRSFAITHTNVVPTISINPVSNSHSLFQYPATTAFGQHERSFLLVSRQRETPWFSNFGHGTKQSLLGTG